MGDWYGWGEGFVRGCYTQLFQSTKTHCHCPGFPEQPIGFLGWSQGLSEPRSILVTKSPSSEVCYWVADCPWRWMENEGFGVSSRTQARVGGCPGQLNPHLQTLEEGTRVGKGLKETRVTFPPHWPLRYCRSVSAWLCWVWEPVWARKAELQGQGAVVAFWGGEVWASLGLLWARPFSSTPSPFLSPPQGQTCAQGSVLGGVLCDVGSSGVCTGVQACVFAFTHKRGQSLSPKFQAPAGALP